MSLMCIDLYETGGLLLFSSKSIIFQTADLERVIEKAENIINFYLDFNWESRFIDINISHLAEKKKGTEVDLSGGADEVMYKSGLCTKMRLWPGFYAQVFRDWADNRLNP